MSEPSPSPTLTVAVEHYLQTVASSRDPKTHTTYAQGVRLFLATLKKHKVDPDMVLASDAQPQWIGWYLAALKDYAEATEAIYLAAVRGLYEYLQADEGLVINMARVQAIIKRGKRKLESRVPPFPEKEIQEILAHAQRQRSELAAHPTQPVPPSKAEAAEKESRRRRLAALRDYALARTLADTGLRIREACSLKRGQLDWNEQQAVVRVKGKRQRVVQFSDEALAAIRDYLVARDGVGDQEKDHDPRPVFAAHHRRAKSLQALTPAGAWHIVKVLAKAALGKVGARIKPHDFRHYFVTTVLLASGGDLKLAQELVGHKSITTTQRYAHLGDARLAEKYGEIFNRRPAEIAPPR